MCHARLAVVATASLLLFTRSLRADVLDVPGDFATIQQAIDAAVDGDTVLVAPGTYLERIDFKGKKIEVKGELGASVTTIDGQAAGCVVRFNTGETRASILRGFTIRNGAATNDGITASGGGIFCQGAPLIEDCVITDNVAHYPGGSAFGSARGGGVYCGTGSEALLRGCTIANNDATDSLGLPSSYGGGVYCHKATLERCLLQDNFAETSGGAIYVEARTGVPCVISDCVATGNSTGFNSEAITIYQFTNAAAAVLDNCQIVGNTAGVTLGVLDATSPGSLVRGCLIAGNTGNAIATSITFPTQAHQVVHCTLAGNGSGVSAFSPIALTNCIVHGNGSALTGSVTATYSLIEGGFAGEGNIAGDPQFVDAGSGDYHLAATSPCIDTGDPAYVPSVGSGRDLDGNSRVLDGDLLGGMIADMGAFEYANIRLTITGSGAPGTSLTLTTSGKAGLPNLLIVGFAEGETLLNPFGYLFWDLTKPWVHFPWFPAPSTRNIFLPADLPVPILLVFQEIAFGGGYLGNTSNGVAITVQ